MQLDEDLEAVKESITGCSLVAFGDLRTQLVLRAVSDQRHTQENLNQFCRQAKNAFFSSDAISEIDGSDHATADHAVMLTQSGVHLFVRSPRNSSDVLCCTCQSYDNVETLLASARAFFGYLARVA